MINVLLASKNIYLVKKTHLSSRFHLSQQVSRCSLLAFLSLFLLAGRVPYSERDKTDFDTVIKALEGQGTWALGEKDEAIFTSNEATKDPNWRPMHTGRWIYTDWGWMLRSNAPGSWATLHYGYWTITGFDHWVWIPGGDWQIHTVDWRETDKYIGWRPTKLDRMGNFLTGESANMNPLEWSFIPVEKFGLDMSPADFLSLEETKKVLPLSAPSSHIIKTWDDVERPGPDPTVVYKKNNSQFIKVELKTLPSVITPPPYESPTEYFLYRPTFHQDSDGMARRVKILLHQEDSSTTVKPQVEELKKKMLLENGLQPQSP